MNISFECGGVTTVVELTERELRVLTEAVGQAMFEDVAAELGEDEDDVADEMRDLYDALAEAVGELEDAA